jgi:hypothetical protein
MVSSTLALFEVLDGREKAALLWLCLIVAYGVVQGGRSVTSSAREVVRSFFRWKLLFLFGTAALYCAGVVALGAWAGLWHTSAAKETVYWFVTGGVVLVGRAVTDARPTDPGFYAGLIRQAVRYTMVIEFLVNLYVFPFLVELVVVPFVLLVLVAPVAAASTPSLASARKPVDWILAAIGCFLLVHVVVKVTGDPSGLFMRENLETLLIAPALTLAFVPLLAAWAGISHREQENLRKRFRPRYDPAA